MNGGIIDDRNFMVVDSDNQFLTQRSCPKLALIQPFIPFRGGHLVLNAPGMPELIVPRHGYYDRAIRVWHHRGMASDLGNQAAGWLSEFLGQSCRLVVRHLHCSRRADSNDSDLGFQDGFPFLLTSMASLEALNGALAGKGLAAVGMERFRANIVVSGNPGEMAAFDEDHWAKIRIGTTVFEGRTLCKRCPIIDTDQATAVRDEAKEPRTTLGEIHIGGIPYFGRNMVHCIPGSHHSLYLNDVVEILQLD